MDTIDDYNGYVPEHEDFQIMRKVYQPDVLGTTKGVTTQAFDFLKDVLVASYGECRFGLLVAAVEKNPFEEARRISRTFARIGELNEWSEKTTMGAVSGMKKIMKRTTLNPNFIDKLTTVKAKGVDRKSIEYCLPAPYKKRAADDPEKMLLTSWLERCKNMTRNKSQSSLKQIAYFVLKACDLLGLDLQDFDEEAVKSIPIETFQKIVDQIDLKIPTKTKVRFAIVVAKTIFKCDIPHVDLTSWSKSTAKDDGGSFADSGVDDRDMHRISNRELELMFETVKSNPRNLALFLLMATTGLRVGGVSNLLLKNVADEVDGKIVVASTGRTLEKGRKWFTFVICERLNHALEKWIVEGRRNVTSEYLFPGVKQNSLSPSRIGKIVKEIAAEAGLDGKHVHAHAIRHSFAHILLEAGNDPGLVGKMMGHASSKTTEKYYLKETAVEASKRCNIPWLTKNVTIEPLPNFMMPPLQQRPESIPPTLTYNAKQTAKRRALKMIAKEFETKGIV